MELILWRHAEAEEHAKGGDLARELTRRGHKQAVRMAAWLRPRAADDWKILASPARRALQTVEPMELPYEKRGGVGPEASTESILREAGWPSGKGTVVVVGHQPTLGQVAAHLLGGGVGDVSIRKGAIWWFATRTREGESEVVLKAVLNPELLE